MLKQLIIKNFTLIDKLDICFCPGFSVITGETGAGKSIILGAVALLLGQRADSKTVKAGADKCTIEAHFELGNDELKPFFEDNDIDYDAGDCILRRELTAAGKSRSFINDTPVPLTMMRAVGQQLVDIHSQHKNLLLQEEDFQLSVVDILADDHGELQAYQQAFNSYRTLEAQLEQTRRDIEKARENEDFLRFQYNELLDAALAPGQQEELEAESEMLSHAEDIKGALYEAARLLDGNGDGIVEKLREATRALYNINNVYPDIAEAAARMESCHIELVDLAQEVGAKAEKMDFDPRRLEEIDERLNKIYSLEKKHRVDTVEQLIALRDDMEARLDTIDNSDENLRQLEQQVAEMRQLCKETAGVLTAKRRSAATTIEKEMTRRLVPLGIPNVRFEVAITPKPIANDGADKVVFLFSANTSTSLQPVSEVASGGEIARVMLALKAMISGAVKLPTIIFDEIDTGVSGKIAEKMALIMKEMGQAERQVISITHLPQIAAMGAAHYKVEKQETPNGTTSTMYRLSAAQREVEIAQMLSGSTVTEAAMSNARELLRQSS